MDEDQGTQCRDHYEEYRGGDQSVLPHWYAYEFFGREDADLALGIAVVLE